MRAQKVARQESLRKVIEAIEVHPMKPDEQRRLLERIMNETIAGVITPKEANAMTRAVNTRLRRAI